MLDLSLFVPMITDIVKLASGLAFIMFGVRIGFRVILNAAEGRWHDIWA